MSDDYQGYADALLSSRNAHRYDDAPDFLSPPTDDVVDDEPSAQLTRPTEEWVCGRCHIQQPAQKPALYTARFTDMGDFLGICPHCAEVVMAQAVTA